MDALICTLRARRAENVSVVKGAQWSRLTALLTGVFSFLLGQANKPMRFRIGVSIEMATNIEAQVARFLLDLQSHNRRYPARLDLHEQLRAQTVDDVKPAITHAKPHAHASFCPVAVPVPEDVGVAAAQKVIKFFLHSFLPVYFGTSGARSNTRRPHAADDPASPDPHDEILAIPGRALVIQRA